MKRITYIANNRLPTEKAHGIQITNMCAALAEVGAHVTLVAPRRRNHLTQDVYAYYAVPRTFTMQYLPVIDLVRFGRFGFWFSELVFTLLAVIRYGFTSTDLFFTRDPLVAACLGILRRPVVWESHAGAHSVVARLAIRYVRRLIVISQGLAEHYVALGVAREKITVLHDAVHVAVFNSAKTQRECRAVLGVADDTKVIMYTGHLYAWKGVDTLIAAAQHLPEEYRIFLVGGTVEDIAAYQKRYAHVSSVQFMGYVPHVLVPTYLRAADVLVLPNSAQTKIGSTFTSPMKLFEYMASKTPIVASDVSALREILDESTAALYTPDNPEALAAAIVETCTDRSRAGTRAATAYERVLGYSWKARAQAVLALI